MADQSRCPACDGTGKEESPPPDFVGDRGGDHSCHPGCPCQRRKEPTEKLGDRAGDASSVVPADVIDRAVGEAIEPLRKRGIIPGKKHLRTAVEIVAPLLMEAGAAQEREKK